MKCYDCKFWEDQGHIGACKRYPKPEIKGSGDWCGEYVAKEMLKLPVIEQDEPKKRGRPAKEK